MAVWPPSTNHDSNYESVFECFLDRALRRLTATLARLWIRVRLASLAMNAAASRGTPSRSPIASTVDVSIARSLPDGLFIDVCLSSVIL